MCVVGVVMVRVVIIAVLKNEVTTVSPVHSCVLSRFQLQVFFRVVNFKAWVLSTVVYY